MFDHSIAFDTFLPRRLHCHQSSCILIENQLQWRFTARAVLHHLVISIGSKSPSSVERANSDSSHHQVVSQHKTKNWSSSERNWPVNPSNLLLLLFEIVLSDLNIEKGKCTYPHRLTFCSPPPCIIRKVLVEVSVAVSKKTGETDEWCAHGLLRQHHDFSVN